MNRKALGLFAILSFLLLGCSDKEKSDKEEGKSSSEKTEINQKKSYDDYLVEVSELLVNEKDYEAGVALMKKIIELYPDEAEEDGLSDELATYEEHLNSLKEIEENGIWAVTYFVDDFGDDTDEGYLTNRSFISGTFSNSATTNSELNVRIIYSQDGILCFKLYEYGDREAKFSSYDDIRAKVKLTNGDTKDFIMSEYTDRVGFKKKDSDFIASELSSGNEIKVFITDNDTPSTKYNFEITETKGFSNAFAELFGEK